MFETKFKISLFVPSADRRGVALDAGAVERALQNAFLVLASVGAGGWTTFPAEGGWVGEAGVIVEDVKVVTSFVDAFNDMHLDMLEIWADTTCRVLNQESVLFTVEKVEQLTVLRSSKD